MYKYLREHYELDFDRSYTEFIFADTRLYGVRFLRLKNPLLWPLNPHLCVNCISTICLSV